jgi:hypothetical protein
VDVLSDKVYEERRQRSKETAAANLAKLKKAGLK